MKKSNYWILLTIIAVAVSVRLLGLDLSLLPSEQKASVILSISLGTLSVIGLYFLVKEMFDEKLAAIASFFLAVSSWHVLLSDIGTEDILVSFALIFAFYFIWHGLKYGRTFNFFLAGLFGGVGFYTGRSYLFAPIVVLLLFWNYWDYIKKDFSLSKYEEVKKEILGGFSLLVITVIVTVLPLMWYIWQNPGFIFSTVNSIFSTTEPVVQFYKNIGWMTDRLLLMEFGGENLISWPLSIFFIIGFIKELIHWLKRKHGHFSATHTLIFSWLFVMAVPALLASMSSIILFAAVLPPIPILSAKGLWWVIEKLNRWNHEIYPRPHKHWVGLDAGPLLAVLALMVSIALLEIF